MADIVRWHGHEYLARYGPLPPTQRYALECLANCRTARLGGHRWQCRDCGHTEQSYNSCGNRHCNKCQAGKRAEWLAARQDDLLPVEYFHVVLTLPSTVAELALQNQRMLYGLLMETAAATLMEVAADPRHLQARIGVLAVLHTWGQNLHHHPHVHCIVPGGGLSPDGERWIGCPSGFFLPVRVLSTVFRAKFLQQLKRLHGRGELICHGSLGRLATEEGFACWLDDAYAVDWVVYAKPPFGGPEQVLKYLARYTHRVAISNQRLVSLVEGQVSFRWKDYARGHRWRTMRLTAVEFLRRLMQHVLPKRFVRIRYYGLLASCHHRTMLERCRQLLAAAEVETDSPGPTEETSSDADRPVDEVTRACPNCRQGRMVVVEILRRCGTPVPYLDSS